MKALAVLQLASFVTSASANCGGTSAAAFEVSLSCAPTQKSLVYRCDVQVLDKQLRAPICVHGGSINFDMPSMPMAHHIPPVQLNTDGEGKMKDWEVRLDMHGDWRVRVDVSGQSVSKVFNFRAKAVIAK
jgi:hypothetical protein